MASWREREWGAGDEERRSVVLWWSLWLTSEEAGMEDLEVDVGE